MGIQNDLNMTNVERALIKNVRNGTGLIGLI
jgi:hypothetical protein